MRLSRVLVEHRYARAPASGATAVDVPEASNQVLVRGLKLLHDGRLAKKAVLRTRHFADVSGTEREHAADMRQREPNHADVKEDSSPMPSDRAEC